MKKKRNYLAIGAIFILFILLASFVKFECSSCNGDGAQTVKTTCSTCKGKGEYRCKGIMMWDGGWFSADFNTNCDGGKHYANDGSKVLDCPNCIGGIVSCESCGGYGYHSSERDCRKCNGNGEQTLLGMLF